MRIRPIMNNIYLKDCLFHCCQMAECQIVKCQIAEYQNTGEFFNLTFRKKSKFQGEKNHQENRFFSHGQTFNSSSFQKK